MIDETKMSEGVLSERGTTNMIAIGEAINRGSIQYNVNYGKIEKDVDFQFCVVSEGKSIFGIQCIVPFVKPDDHSDVIFIFHL